MLLPIDVITCAAVIASEFGEDIDEALVRFEDAGGEDGGEEASAWLSVAFLFGRHLRDMQPSALTGWQ